jgi:heavy metal sensor kinase
MISSLTIKGRLTLWYLLSIGPIILGTALIMYLLFRSDEQSGLDRELRDYSEFLFSEVSNGKSNVADLFDDLAYITDQANTRFPSMRFMLTTRDSVVYDSTARGLSNEIVDSLQHFLNQGGRKGWTTIDVGDQQYRVYQTSLNDSSNTEPGIVVIASLDRINDTLERLRNLLLIIIPASLLVAGVGGWLIARKALAPVDRIREIAASISSTNLGERVPVTGNKDELDRLASTFNEMIERIDVTFKGQRRFVADVSHDLRTPLMVLRTRVDRLLKSTDHSPATHEELRSCSFEIDRLTRLAADLLLLARADAHQLVMASLALRLDDLLFDCVGSLGTLAEERAISIWFDVDDPVEIVGDRENLVRAFTNIIENAIKYSNSPSTVYTRLVERGNEAVVTVSNSGPSIPSEELSRVFDRFFRSDTSRTTPGSGLGLAIAQTIIEAHHGTIQLTSTPDIETIVTVTLPISPR